MKMIHTGYFINIINHQGQISLVTEVNTTLLLSRFIVSDCFAAPWTAAHQAPLSMGFPK